MKNFQSIPKFLGFLELKYEIEVISGLHIGGSKDSIEIGGTDNPVIKLKTYKIKDEILSDVPYIPGSSLKGKVRSLLELAENKPLERFNNYEDKSDWNKAIEYAGKPCDCGKCNICKLFGTGGDKVEEPIRLRFSEFYPTKETIEMWKTYLGEVYTEIKTENVINRITSTAQHPRHTERVIANSIFEGTITFRVFEGDNEKLFQELENGLKLLEKDYLGGNGSRGYGRVKVKLSEINWIPAREDIKKPDWISNINPSGEK
jgi:CRISPR-associated protein Csm3